MFIVFYDTESVILCHGVPVGKNINCEYYQKVNIILKGFEFSKLSVFMKEKLTKFISIVRYLLNTFSERCDENGHGS